MSDTLGDRIRARRAANRNGVAAAPRETTKDPVDTATLEAAKRYVDAQLAALIERNNLKS